MSSGERRESTPKTKASDRLIWLGDDTIGLLRETARRSAGRMQAPPGARHDSDLIFCPSDERRGAPTMCSRR